MVRKWWLEGTASLVAALTAVQIHAQSAEAKSDVVVLPDPTGAHAVGKTLWHWPDPARADTLTDEAADVRELVVQAWYPAAAQEHERAIDGLAYYALTSRAYEQVRDRAVPGAPMAELSAPAPVVILCPGRGAAAYSYSAIAQDLASHGYAVFAFDAPHTGFVRYPDGRTVQPSDKFQIPLEILTGPYERADAFFRPAEELGKGDFDFVVERVAGLNRSDPSNRFTGRLDTTRMGALAHSMGGRACGAGVRVDPRFKALASADGVPPRAARLGGFDQAVLMLVSGDMPPEAMPNFRSVIPQRRNDVYLAVFEDAEHNSIRDRPYLIAEETARAAPAAQLQAYRQLTRRFFDRYVKGHNVVVLEDTPANVTIEVFPRARPRTE